MLSEHGLPIAPSTYYEARDRPPSARALRDEQLRIEIGRVHQVNYDVYGARKVWMTLGRQDMPVARCRVERLMVELGLSGARRGAGRRSRSAGSADLVDRLDTEHQLVSVDVLIERGYWGSSAAAKKIDADLRISLASLGSLFSARSFRTSAAMSDVMPGRRPESI